MTDAVGSTDGCEGRSSDEDGDDDSSSDDVGGDLWAGGEAADSCSEIGAEESAVCGFGASHERDTDEVCFEGGNRCFQTYFGGAVIGADSEGSGGAA